MNRRNTHQKEVILQVIEGQGNHLTAEEVYQRVNEIDDKIGLATIYRNLNLLYEQGQISKVIGDGLNLFDGNPNPHDHFHCKECGKLEDIPYYEEKTMDHHAEKMVQGKVIRHSILYEGICKDCLERQKEKKTWN